MRTYYTILYHGVLICNEAVEPLLEKFGESMIDSFIFKVNDNHSILRPPSGFSIIINKPYPILHYPVFENTHLSFVSWDEVFRSTVTTRSTPNLFDAIGTIKNGPSASSAKILQQLLDIAAPGQHAEAFVCETVFDDETMKLRINKNIVVID